MSGSMAVVLDLQRRKTVRRSSTVSGVIRILIRAVNKRLHQSHRADLGVLRPIEQTDSAGLIEDMVTKRVLNIASGTGTPPQQDVGTDTLPTAASGNSSAAREETRNKPASIAPAEFEAPNMSAPDPPSSSSQLSLSSGTKRKIRKMLRLANHAQSIYQKETERFAALEAFAARASEVRLTSREHEFDRQLVSEITVLREVRDPALVDLEAQGTLKLAEELRRDVSEFQRRFGDGKGSKSLRQQGGQKGA
ncbi:hypothetical protein FRB90_001173 [Tulasnella sp. 427]|nr:hypothetical protein FRB90_001173 [Tulasnella sp. 427]